MGDYEKLLDTAYKNVKKVDSVERFEIPKAKSMIEGSKTIITNFSQIFSTLRRDPLHLAKYLSRELATPVNIEKDRAILNRKLSPATIDGKIAEYVKEFVICPECKKPDTELLKDKGFLFIHCLACGAKHSVRVKIH
ncbi:MAG: translation initiation factor IF-2 subunit beta [archaeon]|nr:MAG: translation initiation factor IF-2 subunit beta [archaeon]